MKYTVNIIMTALLLASTIGLAAAEVVDIPQVDTPPAIDGKMDEAIWTTAAKFEDFKTLRPDYGKAPADRTVLYACSDRENFYFALRCFQDPATIKGTVTRRDNMYGDDYVGINIDTFHDLQNAYGFVVNPLGIQGDGMVNADGDMNGSHDMVWYSKGLIDDKGYTVEIKIPFKSIRFPVKKSVKMGLWLVRSTVYNSQVHTCPELFPDKGATLGQARAVLVKNMKYQRIVEILPAVTHARSRYHEDGQWAPESRQSEFSLTGKLGITPSLVLDATYNPDFSQVEADAGQADVNLRHAIYYQEKRPFFLEGMETFRFAGNTEDAPLYSVVHTRNIVDPVFGLKLTGKVNGNDSVAAIFALDEPLDEAAGADGRSGFGIFRFRHILKKDSYAGVFYAGREVSGGYNRVAGVDGRLRLSTYGTAEYHFFGSLNRDPDSGVKSEGHALGLRYSNYSRKFLFDIGVQDISPDFQVDSGFLTRRGITRIAGFAMRRFYPKSKFFQRIEPFYWSFHLRDKESGLWETFNLFTLRFNMPRSSSFRFDVIASNEVFAGRRFPTSGFGIQAWSQLTGQFRVNVFFRHTGAIYYDEENPFGGRANRGALTLEYQPTDKFTTSLRVSYNDFVRRSDKQKEYDYIILRSRTTFQVNKYFFLRAVAEYNHYREELLLDALASFTYIPGTVVHVGYSSGHDRMRWGGTEYIPADRFMENRRAFFLKISYLWRL